MNRVQWFATISWFALPLSPIAPAFAQPSQVQPSDTLPVSADLIDVPAPFELSETEQKQIDAILHDWEKHSRSIRWFQCEFTRWQYKAFSTLGHEAEIARGEISYRWPNQASYRQFDPRQVAWSRDSKAVYEFDYDRKLVIERSLPESLCNQEIESWPLPLMYRVRAADVTREYWVRVSPDSQRQGELRLEFHPRQRPANLHATLLVAADVINGRRSFCPYQRLDVLLDATNLVPLGLRIAEPNGGQTSFAFTGRKMGSNIDEPQAILCEFPLPSGWKRVSDFGQSSSSSK